MNVPSNLAKSCSLATIIFWAVIAIEPIEFNALPFVILSVIPVFFCTSLVIVLTICPFFWTAKTKGANPVKVFKTWHPYYTIICFGISISVIVLADFESFIIAFFTSAFITTNQSWVWFAKANPK
ncbi:hypothetical protein [Psychroserpens sp. SPM9]|uniref:hypothetical protein n=1 Tax=Psychroserpens sp. SPM9 TaxID=2975598 RepID=UPI0021A78B48|nr:hypothetical protein [Psychroserpens sp. SPM9]MDG5492668.1 hypothetical protein [Psychroserpens sp. SPM9]